MLLIYTHTGSARLLYICSFIFKEQLGIPFQLTIDSEKFKSHTGPKLNYSDTRFTTEELHCKNHQLLYEKNIEPQAIECFTVNSYKAFFKTTDSDFPFDIFAASFYLITRYEEYLPHKKDMYGRYAYENSLAYKEGFLKIPLINFWVNNFAVSLKAKFSSLVIQQPAFRFLPTYDIDIAWSYKHKGLFRNIGGFLQTPSAERIKVLTGFAKDPFDCYNWLKDLHEKYQLQPIYFFLLAEKNGQYDKNILPQKDAMWKLVRKHANKFTVGLHPSWQSGDDKLLLKKEKEQLEDMIEGSFTGQATTAGQTGKTMVQAAGSVPTQVEARDHTMVQTAKSVPTLAQHTGSIPAHSRQHYIRFNLPEGFQRLIAAGITDDYSMGYGSINGFRASVASSFYWYNLEKDENTALRIHPFCFMDANSFYEQKQHAEQTLDEMKYYLSVCKEVNGTLITIMHNNFLGTFNEFSGWAAMYEKFIAQVQ